MTIQFGKDGKTFEVFWCEVEGVVLLTICLIALGFFDFCAHPSPHIK